MMYILVLLVYNFTATCSELLSNLNNGSIQWKLFW